MVDYLVPVNYIKSVADVVIKASFSKNKIASIKLIDVKKQKLISKNNKKNLIVFVLGESARASNFSLNSYERNTNEFLENYNIVNFSNFYSCGTSTFISVPCMFSHLERKNYSKKNFLKYENLLDVFKDLDYTVNWYSNNGGCKGVCDRVNFKLANDEYDIGLLKYLKNDVERNKDNNLFIILHQRGSHGPEYIKRYPKNFEKFSPTCSKELYDCERQELINTYDNTINYTSYFIKETIDFLKTKNEEYNVFFVYVSDHGESLGENRQFMHGYPYNLANDYQKHIPFILWFSDSFVENFNVNINYLKNISNNKYSHDNIFHSIIGLFGIKSDFYKNNLSFF